MQAMLIVSLVIAGLMHLALTGEHLEESAILGAGFVAAGVVQLALGAALLRAPNRATFGIVAALNLALVLLYVAHVTVGLPLGGDAPSREEVTPSGLGTKAAELAGILLALRLVARRAEPSVAERKIRRPAA